jgi:quinol-cytochrome oxidoreductase complex cytochrome b subunit
VILTRASPAFQAGSSPHAVAVITVATWLAVTVLALVIPSPLEEAANPLLTPNPAKAPWYFLWLQEIVADTTVRLGPLTKEELPENTIQFDIEGTPAWLVRPFEGRLTQQR